MNLLLDTNILVDIARDKTQTLLNQINPQPQQQVYVSIVSMAELKSFALMNNWTQRKIGIVNRFLGKAIILEVNEDLLYTYAEIDAFSQRRNPAYIDYPFATPRNMGKNDLWIASTAALLGLKLVTADADFNHLHQVFLEVQHIRQTT